MSFTMFDKFADVFEQLPPEQGKELAYAVTMYGFTGEEPDLEYPLNLMFGLMREDVENSKTMRQRAGRGGRPRKTKATENAKTSEGETAKQEVSENSKPEVSENEKPEVSENQKPKVSENAKPEVSEKRKPKPTQTKPDHSQTNVCLTRTDAPPGDDEAFWAFARDAQAAYNRILDTDVREFSPNVHYGLRRAWDNGRRLPDVERAVRAAKNDWKPKYITPESVLDRHFEALVNKEASGGDYSEYDLPDSD